MKNTILATYQDNTVRFNRDGWINATTVATLHGKRVDQWLNGSSTQQHLLELAIMGFHVDDLIQVHRGRTGGTWLHPKLAAEFARWIDLKFAIWCGLIIERLLREKLTEKLRYELAYERLANAREIASKNGKELAKWRWAKPGLEYEVAHWKHQMQLTLGLDMPS
ncbi:KilA-N domain-containing protein [Pseudomonas chlororaphis]|uniref:KilA-N domain-containing protein n=1 Tax=Pseudomonas chlororaphis TaxID=587753 RepID=UPI003C23E3F7